MRRDRSVFDRFVDLFRFSRAQTRQMQGFELDFEPPLLRFERDRSERRPETPPKQGRRQMKTLVASTAALLLLAGAAPGFAAQAETETVSIPVSKAKLNLNNPQDAQRMMRRIDAAALQACGADAHSFPYVKQAVAASACHREAVAGAVSQLNSPQASLTVTGVRNR